MAQEHNPLEDAIAKMQQIWTQVQPTPSEELDKAAFLAKVKEQMPERQRISDDAWEIAHRVACAVSRDAWDSDAYLVVAREAARLRVDLDEAKGLVEVLAAAWVEASGVELAAVFALSPATPAQASS